MGRIELTDEQVNALNYMFDLAFSDQATYLGDGSLSVSYGVEWPRAARLRASLCRTIAQLTTCVGAEGDRERWDALASGFECTLTAAAERKDT